MKVFIDQANCYRFRVESATRKNEHYIVTLNQRDPDRWRELSTCTCPEHTFNRRCCKHIVSVAWHIWMNCPREFISPAGTRWQLLNMTYYADREGVQNEPAQRFLTAKQTITITQPAHTLEELFAIELSNVVDFRARGDCIYTIAGDCIGVMFDHVLHAPDFGIMKQERGITYYKHNRAIDRTPYNRTQYSSFFESVPSLREWFEDQFMVQQHDLQAA